MNAPPMKLVRTGDPLAPLGVVGDADILHTAFLDHTLVTLDGKFAGEHVYLGYRVHMPGGMETQGRCRTIGEVAAYPGRTIAIYYVDMRRLDGAPEIAAMVARVSVRQLRQSMAADQRANAEERWLMTTEDGA